MQYWIINCPNKGLYVEGLKNQNRSHQIARCVKDPLGNYITDIKYYTIEDNKIKSVDYKGWLTRDVI